MRGPSDPIRLRHPAAAVAVLLALLLRLAVPAGYMLSPDGALALVPCPASAPIAAAPHLMDMGPEHAMHMAPTVNQAPQNHDHPAHPGDTCPFAAVSAPAVLATPPWALAPLSLLLAELTVPEEQNAQVTRLAAPPPPSRGPPFLT